MFFLRWIPKKGFSGPGWWQRSAKTPPSCWADEANSTFNFQPPKTPSKSRYQFWRILKNNFRIKFCKILQCAKEKLILHLLMVFQQQNLLFDHHNHLEFTPSRLELLNWSYRIAVAMKYGLPIQMLWQLISMKIPCVVCQMRERSKPQALKKRETHAQILHTVGFAQKMLHFKKSSNRVLRRPFQKSERGRTLWSFTKYHSS